MSDDVGWHRGIVFFFCTDGLKRLAAMKAVGCRAQWLECVTRFLWLARLFGLPSTLKTK